MSQTVEKTSRTLLTRTHWTEETAAKAVRHGVPVEVRVDGVASRIAEAGGQP